MKEYLQKLSGGQSLSMEETSLLFDELVQTAADSQIGAYLFSTSTRIPKSEELIGAAKVLRKYMLAVDLKSVFLGHKLLDTCGTGGSGLCSFNTSTVCAFVCASCGQYVAKHGNRGATSQSGSVDLLEALGIRFALSSEQIIDCCLKTKFCFMFAPKHHTATARVVKIRKELGVRTIFNFLGPLANPAQVQIQLLGVSKKEVAPAMAEALIALGVESGMIVYGHDGLDEISVCAETDVYEIHNDRVSYYKIAPEDFGMKRRMVEEIKVRSPEDAANKTKAVLSGEQGAYRDIVLLNAAAALYLSDKAKSIRDGIKLAIDAIDSGRALKVLNDVIEVSSSYDTN